MAATTAHILIGRAHPNDGGLVTVHRIELSEGSRPAWTLKNGQCQALRRNHPGLETIYGAIG